MSNNAAPAQDEFFESLLGDFLDESQQLLGSLNENMLALDQWVQAITGGDVSPLDEELMNELFRSAHSFKGLSGMLGLTDINNLTHNIENVFDAARRGQYQLTPESVELLFQAIDHLVSMVECLRDPELPTDDCTDVISRIKNLLSDAGVGKEQQSQSDAEKSLAELDQALAAATAEEPVEDQPSPPKEDLFGGIEDENEVPAKYLAIYIDESEQSLDAINEALLSTEANNSVSTVEDVLIAAHRFKGSSASVGLNRAAKLAHFMEDILQLHREQQLTLSPELTDAMLKCTDALRVFIEQLKQGQRPSVESFNDLAYDLVHANLKPSGRGNSETHPQDVKLIKGLPDNIPTLDLARQTDLIAHISEDTVGVLGLISFDPSFPMLDLKAQLVLRKLGQLGKVRYSDPSEDTLEDCQDLSQLAFVLDSDHSPESVWRALHIASVKRVEVKRVKKLLCGGIDHGEDGPDVRQYDYSLQSSIVKKPASVAAVEMDEEPAESILTEDLDVSDIIESEDQALSQRASVEAAPEQPKPTAAPKTAVKPAPPARVAEQKQRAGKPAEASKPNETLRVDIERLDQLMNLAGQLVINKARFARIGEGLKPLLASKRSKSVMGSVTNTLARISEEAETGLDGKNPQMQFESIRAHARRLQADLERVQNDLRTLAESRSGIVDLIEAVHQLDRVSDGIQKSVMDTRMVPVGPLFTRFKRVVRDITRSNGKDIQLVIRGEKTELDKRMIDGLGDPLIHMVRNSADHGVETPEERIAAGKPPQGEIILDAFHRGNSIVIQIKDDGRGLPTEKLRQKAIDKGVVSEADAEKLSAYQVYQLIWEPGFSTAEKVTEISGRGMGMDIVRSKIEELSGVVDLDSVPGEGTTFTIKLPLTLAILPSLMAKIQGEVFALPIESVVEIVSVRREDMSRVHGLQTATVRDRVVAVAKLHEVFTWNTENESGFRPRATESDETTLVIIGVAGRELGLCVDQLLGEEDVVIKSMAENYRNVEGVAGASILGDGRVALILDTSALIDMSSRIRRNSAEVTA